MRHWPLGIGVGLLALAAGVAVGEDGDALRERMGKFEYSLFVDGGKGGGFKQRPEAEQRPEVAAFFGTLHTAAEKVAFLDMGYDRYVYAINREVYGEFAVRLLKDEDAEVRRDAVRGLTYKRLSQYGKEVVPLLDDKDEGVRIQALAACGVLGQHGLAGRMGEVAKSAVGEKERVAGLQGVGLLILDKKSTAEQRERELGILVLYLELTAAPAMQEVALGVMQQDAGAAKYEGAIVKLTGSDSAPVRVDAVKALGKLTSAASAEAIRGRLSDEADSVRTEAAKALGERKDKGSAGEIAKLLDDPVYRVRSTAVEALVAMGAADFGDAIAGCIGDEEAEVRISAIKAMGVFKAKGHQKEVIAALGDENHEARLDAARVLGVIGTAECVPAVAGMAGDKNAMVRYEVVRVLDVFDARDQRAVVEKLAGDADKDTSSEAKELLARWGRKR